MKKLSNRLSAIAELARGFERVADVGTDHGYIPVWLLETGSARHVIASDINVGPLERARLTAAENGITDGIEFAVSDGMAHLEKGAVDAVIIAGMGGETIVKILSAAREALSGVKTLILQPMTKTEELTAWLFANGYRVSDARLAEDDGELYLILCAMAGEAQKPSPAALYAPEKLLENRDALLGRYLDALLARLKYAAEGMKSARELRDPERLSQLEGAISGLMKMKGEYEDGNGK